MFEAFARSSCHAKQLHCCVECADETVALGAPVMKCLESCRSYRHHRHNASSCSSNSLEELSKAHCECLGDQAQSWGCCWCGGVIGLGALLGKRAVPGFGRGGRVDGGPW